MTRGKSTSAAGGLRNSCRHTVISTTSGHDLESPKDFLKRIGSNLRFSGQILRIAYEERRRKAPFADLRMENPWAILARRRENAKWWAVLESNRRNRKRAILGARPSPRSNRRPPD